MAAVPAQAPAAAVTVATGAEALDLLDARWDDLLARTTLPSPLLATTWLRQLARWERPTRVPLVAVAESGGALVAAAALEAHRPSGRLGPLVATWLGPEEQRCCTDVLVDPARPEAAEALLAGVLAQVDAVALVTTASGVAARTLAAVAPWRDEHPFLPRWLLRLPPPRLEHVRKEVAYDCRRAARRGADVQVRIAAEPDEVERALVRFFRVHRERWNGRAEEEARFATTALHRRWNLRAIGAMAALGHVRLAEVVEDGRTVAAALGFVFATGAVGHTIAFRPGGALRQPGHLAALARAEALAEAGARTLDLGYGSGEPGGPKRRLGPEPDPLVTLYAARTQRRQRAYDAARRLRRRGG